MQPSSPYSPGPQKPGPPPANKLAGPPHPEQYYTTPQFDNGASHATAPEHHDYTFITNPETPPKKLVINIASRSLVARLIIALVGMFVLLIVFVIIKSVLGSGSSNGPALLSVIQDQQELVHLATNAGQQQGADTTTLNSAYTVQAAVTTAQQQLTTYCSNIGLKFVATEFSQKVSSQVDAELTTAATNGTYDQTYQSVLQSMLATYGQDLKQAYRQTQGPKGRALLTADYNGQQLLLQQLNSPAS